MKTQKMQRITANSPIREAFDAILAAVKQDHPEMSVRQQKRMAKQLAIEFMTQKSEISDKMVN